MSDAVTVAPAAATANRSSLPAQAIGRGGGVAVDRGGLRERVVGLEAVVGAERRRCARPGRLEARGPRRRCGARGRNRRRPALAGRRGPRGRPGRWRRPAPGRGRPGPPGPPAPRRPAHRRAREARARSRSSARSLARQVSSLPITRSAGVAHRRPVGGHAVAGVHDLRSDVADGIAGTGTDRERAGGDHEHPRAPAQQSSHPVPSAHSPPHFGHRLQSPPMQVEGLWVGQREQRSGLGRFRQNPHQNAYQSV